MAAKKKTSTVGGKKRSGGASNSAKKREWGLVQWAYWVDKDVNECAIALVDLTGKSKRQAICDAVVEAYERESKRKD